MLIRLLVIFTIIALLVAGGCLIDDSVPVIFEEGTYIERRTIVVKVEHGENACDKKVGYILPNDPEVILICVQGDHREVQDVFDHEFRHLRDEILGIPPTEELIKINR